MRSHYRKLDELAGKSSFDSNMMMFDNKRHNFKSKSEKQLDIVNIVSGSKSLFTIFRKIG